MTRILNDVYPLIHALPASRPNFIAVFRSVSNSVSLNFSASPTDVMINVVEFTPTWSLLLDAHHYHPLWAPLMNCQWCYQLDRTLSSTLFPNWTTISFNCVWCEQLNWMILNGGHIDEFASCSLVRKMSSRSRQVLDSRPAWNSVYFPQRACHISI